MDRRESAEERGGRWGAVYLDKAGINEQIPPQGSGPPADIAHGLGRGADPVLLRTGSFS